MTNRMVYDEPAYFVEPPVNSHISVVFTDGYVEQGIYRGRNVYASHYNQRRRLIIDYEHLDIHHVNDWAITGAIMALECAQCGGPAYEDYLCPDCRMQCP